MRLGFLLLITQSSGTAAALADSEPINVCYFTNWAQYRRDSESLLKLFSLVIRTRKTWADCKRSSYKRKIYNEEKRVSARLFNRCSRHLNRLTNQRSALSEPCTGTQACAQETRKPIRKKPFRKLSLRIIPDDILLCFREP